jgi:hypothetical protein
MISEVFTAVSLDLFSVSIDHRILEYVRLEGSAQDIDRASQPPDVLADHFHLLITPYALQLCFKGTSVHLIHLSKPEIFQVLVKDGPRLVPLPVVLCLLSVCRVCYACHAVETGPVC